MTTKQLEKLGITTDTWLTLENKFNNISLLNDGHLYPSPANSQYYFDSSRLLLYVRYTFPSLFKTKKQNDMVEVELSSGTFWLQLLPGGALDSTVGEFHEVFSFDSIVAFSSGTMW